ncbi:TetR/AcrR family transcriptional regulator [Rhodococcus sp. NPDC058639]|uniref:TetR/AcrR family transcriptional regulator n=1 Tax=unclassified Rhodococcus (in: high G+C Gram-positive bacteria) TaxID=192944 RepID=UPI00364A9F8F
MASRRRIGPPDAEKRGLLLDAAEQLMVEEGYAAVSSRRVADKAGLKPQIFFYYFRTMDELFLAVFRRRADKGLEQYAAALESARPLSALWTFAADSAGTRLNTEFLMLSNHRTELKAEIAHYSERFRRMQTEAVSGLLERREIDVEEFPPVVISVLLTSLSRLLVMENALGFSSGHPETVEFIERYFRKLEGEPEGV